MLDEFDGIVEVEGARYNPLLHPSAQVNNYAEYMRDFMTLFADAEANLDAVAYLHNARYTDIPSLFADEASSWARIFTGDTKDQFAEYHTKNFSPNIPGSRAAAFITSRIAPSKQ